jgi:hypothetical protein
LSIFFVAKNNVEIIPGIRRDRMVEIGINRKGGLHKLAYFWHEWSYKIF